MNFLQDLKTAEADLCQFHIGNGTRNAFQTGEKSWIERSKSSCEY